MNLLIDTNVILNMVFKRTGYEDAVLLFKKIKEEHHCAFITASAVPVITPSACVELL